MHLALGGQRRGRLIALHLNLKIFPSHKLIQLFLSSLSFDSFSLLCFFLCLSFPFLFAETRLAVVDTRLQTPPDLPAVFHWIALATSFFVQVLHSPPIIPICSRSI